MGGACALAVRPKIQHHTKLGMATRCGCCRRRNDKSERARARWRRLLRRLRRVQRLKRAFHWLGRWLCYLKHGNRYYKLNDTDNDSDTDENRYYEPGGLRRKPRRKPPVRVAT